MVERLRIKERGQSLVEFALILPVLLLFIFVIVEAGRMFQGWLTVQNAARDAGRYAITGQFETDCLNTFPFCVDARVDSIKAEARKAVAGLDIDYNALPGEPRSLIIEVWSINDDGEWVPDFAGGPNRPIRVRVFYEMPVVTPLLRPIIESVRLKGQVVVNTEDYEQVSEVQGPTAPPDIEDIGDNPTDSGLPEADLVIRKSASISEVVVGGLYQYFINVTNEGPFIAEEITVVDTFPDGVTVISTAVSGGGDCDPLVGISMTCNLPNLGAGSQAQVAITLTAPSEQPDPNQIVNTATTQAGPSTIDPNTPNTDSVAVTVRNQQADVEISKSSSVDALRTDDPFTYILNVKNNGPEVATGVVISDTLPEEAIYLGGEITLSGSGDCSVSGKLVTCDGIGLGVGGVGTTIQIPVTANAVSVPVNVDNTAEITSADFDDPDDSNNRATKTVVISNLIHDLFVTKSGPSDPVEIDDEFSYVLTVGNADGMDDADFVVLTDTLPISFTFVSGDDGCNHVGSGIIRCDLLPIPSGAPVRTVVLTVRPEDAGIFTNNAVIASEGAGVDSNLSNNSDSIDTEVAATDLAITKSGDDIVLAGEKITYTLTIVNKGPGEPINTQVIDLLPANLSQVQVQNSTSGACQVSATELRCVLDFGESGFPFPGSATITITGIAPSDELIVNEASVNSFTQVGGSEVPLPDINPVDNTDIITQTTIPLADMEIIKFAIPDFSETESRFNAVLEYLIQVTNRGPSVAESVWITDTLPTGTVFKSVSSVCALDDSGVDDLVVCDLGDMIPGPTTNLTVAVTTTLAGLITNTVVVDAVTDDHFAANDDDSVVVTVLPANLFVDKIAPPSALVTETITYTMIISNNGPSMATNVVLTDTWPDIVELPFIISPEGICDNSDNPIVCDLGTMLPLSAITITMVATPTAEGPAINFVKVWSPAVPTSDLSDDSDQTNTQIVPIADLAIGKSAQGTFYAGEPITYTLVVTNNGPSTAAGIVVSDTLPNDLLNVTATPDSSGSCSTVTNNLVVCQLSSLPLGDLWTITIVALTDAHGEFVNSAAVSASTLDFVSINDSVTITTDIIPTADLAITKTTDPSSLLVRGMPVTYTVSVVNNGPSTASLVSVEDVFQALGPITVTEPSDVCNVGGLSVSCGLGEMVRDVPINITLVAVPDFEGVLTNTASVTNTVEVDRTPLNNTVVVTETIKRSADLVIDIFDDGSDAVAGDSYDYTIVVTNTGPSTATGGTVTGFLPVDWTFVGSVGACGGAGANEFTCTLAANLAVGGVDPFVIAASVPASVTSGVIVTTTVTITGIDFDPDPANSDSEDTTVVRHANLIIEKRNVGNPATAGETHQYELEVTNLDGPSYSSGFVISDTLPNVSAIWTLAGSSGANCVTIGDNQFSCDANQELSIGNSHVINVTVNVPSSEISGTTRTNNVEVIGYDIDPVSANTAGVSTDVVRDGFLTIDKEGTSSAVAGQTYTYFITVTNEGPSDSSGGIFTDTLPSNWTYSGGDGSGCTPISGGFTCPVLPQVKGTEQNFTLDVNVPADALSGTDTNTVVVKGNQTSTTNADSEDTTVTREVNLTVEKSDNGVLATAGQTVTYVITATNNGALDASGFVITDTLPAGWQWLSGDCLDSSPPPNEFRCENNTGLSAGGGTQTFVVNVDIPAGENSGNYDNFVVIGPVSGDIETDNTDNTGSDDTDVIRNVTLDITKTVSSGPWYIGEPLTYFVNVTNNGPSVASNLTITDVLPTAIGYTDLSYASSAGSCLDASGVITCTVGLLDPFATVSLTITLVPTSTGDATNNAFARANESTGPSASASVNPTIKPAADLLISKTNSTPAIINQVLTYTIVVTNIGPSQATSVNVSDTLPITFTNPVSSTTQGNCSSAGTLMTCALGTMAVNDVVTITVSGVPTSTGAMTNVASVSSILHDPDPSNSKASITTVISSSFAYEMQWERLVDIKNLILIGLFGC